MALRAWWQRLTGREQEAEENTAAAPAVLTPEQEAEAREKALQAEALLGEDSALPPAAPTPVPEPDLPAPSLPAPESSPLDPVLPAPAMEAPWTVSEPASAPQSPPAPPPAEPPAPPTPAPDLPPVREPEEPVLPVREPEIPPGIPVPPPAVPDPAPLGLQQPASPEPSPAEPPSPEPFPTQPEPAQPEPTPPVPTPPAPEPSQPPSPNPPAPPAPAPEPAPEPAPIGPDPGPRPPAEAPPPSGPVELPPVSPVEFPAPAGLPEIPPAAPEEAPSRGFFGRLRQGLSRSTHRLTENLTGLFTKKRLDDEALEELEEGLITADLGVAAAGRIVERFRRTRFGKEVSEAEVKTALAEEIAEILTPIAKPMAIDTAHAPHVVLVVGVNGTGKTTTIAKLGEQYRNQGLRCGFVAGDTFRAAAVEQLQIWGERTGARVFAPAKQGADAAGLAFDALSAARQEGLDVLLVDTAGRLHNKSALMEELRKVVRVMQRVDATAPHSVLLVLDATTGQNALNQGRVFKEMVAVTGLAVTKLDGSAKGGVVVAMAEELGLPVHMVGVGEKAADLRPFSAQEFSRGLLGI